MSFSLKITHKFTDISKFKHKINNVYIKAKPDSCDIFFNIQMNFVQCCKFKRTKGKEESKSWSCLISSQQKIQNKP